VARPALPAPLAHPTLVPVIPAGLLPRTLLDLVDLVPVIPTGLLFRTLLDLVHLVPVIPAGLPPRTLLPLVQLALQMVARTLLALMVPVQQVLALMVLALMVLAQLVLALMVLVRVVLVSMALVQLATKITPQPRLPAQVPGFPPGFQGLPSLPSASSHCEQVDRMFDMKKSRLREWLH
jgi:hypothetical protein